MRSKILISLDDNNKPCLKITKEVTEDVRDVLVSRFLEEKSSSKETYYRLIWDNDIAFLKPVKLHQILEQNKLE